MLLQHFSLPFSASGVSSDDGKLISEASIILR